MATSDTSSFSVDAKELAEKPLWNYVTRLEKEKGGGNWKLQCTYCDMVFKGSYSRVKAHLLRIANQGIRSCPKVKSEDLRQLQKQVDEAEEMVRNAKPKEVPLPTAQSRCQASYSSAFGIGSSVGSSSFRCEGFEPKKRRAGAETSLEKAFNLGAREQLNSEIARMFYSGGVPFHLARNPFYASSYTFAANTHISGYVPPGYNMLRTTLLQKERENVQRLLQPIRETWNEKGISLVSDGWTDAQRRPLINFMTVTESGPMFLKAINCEGEYKDKFFISNLIKETIQEVGPQHVIQVITDNAPVCKAAGILIEAQFPHVFWTPCVVHTLNLALKNICAAKNTEANEVTFDECSWITIIAADIMIIKNFIMNHSMRLSMFNDFVELKMLAVAETRFASVIIMMKRFKLIKHGLQNMVISERWSSYKEDDVGKARFVKEKLLDDDWWENVDYILSFTEPIYEMLRIADTDMPSLHLVYDMWDTMIEKVKRIIYQHEKKEEHEESLFYSVIHKILEDRWTKSNTPLHCMAHSLNPRYYSPIWLKEDAKRLPPHKDLEIVAERNKCMRRYFPNAEERRMANLEYARFSGAMDAFSEHDSLHDRGEIDAKSWWLIHGVSAPRLQNLSLKLLGQPCSSSCCERNWSAYSFINSMKRNKITP